MSSVTTSDGEVWIGRTGEGAFDPGRTRESRRSKQARKTRALTPKFRAAEMFERGDEEIERGRKRK